MKLFSVSSGLKRRVAALLTTLLGLLQAHPELAVLMPWVEAVATFFGLAGVAHAAKAKTIKGQKTVSLTALLPILVAAARNIPELHSFQGLITLLSALISVTVLTFQNKNNHS